MNNAELQIFQLRRRLPNSSTEQQTQILADLKNTIILTELTEFFNFHEEFGLLLNELVDTCIPTLGPHLLDVLEKGAEKYTDDISDSELASVHVALSSIVRKFRFHSSSSLRFLKLYPSKSSELPPLGVSDVALYFENCNHILSRVDNWKDSAIHAALAFSVYPNIDRFRMWYLSELIAHGTVSGLPRVVWSGVSCPIITKLGHKFDNKSREEWPSLIKYCDEHTSDFETWGVDLLVKRALATYCVQWARTIFSRVICAPISILLDPFLESGITLNELINAGLTDFCEIHDDMISPYESRSAATNSDGLDADDSEQSRINEATRSLQTVADLSSRLQRDVYDSC